MLQESAEATHFEAKFKISWKKKGIIYHIQNSLCVKFSSNFTQMSNEITGEKVSFWRSHKVLEHFCLCWSSDDCSSKKALQLYRVQTNKSTETAKLEFRSKTKYNYYIII